MAGLPDIGLAAKHFAAQDYQATSAVCLAIIRDDPAHFDALHLLGVVLSRLDKPAEALTYLRRAAEFHPASAQLQTNLCNALLALKRYDEALTACQAALDQTPDDPGALNNLGLIHKAMNDPPAAIAAFRRAVAVRFDFAQAWYNLATVLAGEGRLTEALEASRAAQRVAPLDTPPARLADVANEVCQALVGLGRVREALAECRRFLRRHPDEPSVRWNLSLALLLLGDYAEGWPAYECRWQVPDHDPRPEGSAVLDPDGIAGRHVLILTEQGRGDMLQFVRYAGLLRDKGARRVSLQAYPDLVALLSAMPGIDQVVSTDNERPAADLCTPVMSLPLAFGTGVATVPAPVPYLAVPPDRLARWRDRLGPPARRRVGIAWSGSIHSYRRSAMPAALLGPVLTLAGVDFHCLQTEINEADRAWLAENQPGLHLHDSELTDFADTAALMSLIDLVITIDTAVAHLAGALALPVWIMLPFSPDWRWLLGRDDSPWYPTARLFRQPDRGRWDAVVQAVAAALRRLAWTDAESAAEASRR